MYAISYSENGTSSVLNYGEHPDPLIRDHEVLIKVHYIAIEGGDILNRKVTPPVHIPFIPGYQVAGEIVKLGDAVSGLEVGQRVVAFNWQGSHAELFATRAAFVYPVPEGLSLDIAATMPVAFGTAHDALFEFGNLQAGETVLIQGAAGGVGLAAVQLAKRAGARVIGTSSRDERLQRLQAFGLDEGVNYKRQDLAEVCLQLTQGEGVDLVLDMAGGGAVDDLIKATRYRGRFAVVGAACGDLSTFKFFDIVRKSLHLYGVSFGREMHTPRVHAMIDQLFKDMAKGELQLPIDRVFALKDAAQAHDYVDFDHPFGRVLMQP